MKPAPFRPPLPAVTITQSLAHHHVAPLSVPALRLTLADFERIGWVRVVFEDTRTLYVWASE